MASDKIFLDAELAEAGRRGTHPLPSGGASLVASATSDEINVLVLPLIPIACWRMDDVRFGFDSSFILPAARKEMGLLREVIASHPDSPISIFGHADPTGADDYNKKLAGRRARAVYAVLIRDADAWEKDLYSTPLIGDEWGLQQIQTILQNLMSKDGNPFYQGSLDGIEGPQTRKALRDFQAVQGLSATGANDAHTRKQLFRSYMDFLCTGSDPKDTLKLSKSDFLGGGADSDGKGDLQGCGEFNPVLVFSSDESTQFSKPELKDKRDAENAPNRRVTAFVFEKGRSVTPNLWPCPKWNEGPAGCRKRFFSDGEIRRNPRGARRIYEQTRDTFACRFYDRFARPSPCEGSGRMSVFRVRLCNRDRDPIANAPCRVVQGEQKLPAQARDNGFITLIAKATPPTVTIEWTVPGFGDDAFYPFSLDVFVAPGAGEQGGFQRLHNLGYLDDTLEDKVRAFQKDFGRPQTGKLSDIESELIAWHDGGNKPRVLVR